MKSSYQYRALSIEGQILHGHLEAISRDELREKLFRKGLSLISAVKTSQRRKVRINLSQRKVKPLELKTLYIHLKQFDEASIPLKESIRELASLQESTPLRQVLRLVEHDLDQGLLLSESLKKYPHIFSPLACHLMSVGEKTGRFSIHLEHLIQHLVWQEKNLAKLEKGLRYPLLLIVGVVLTVCVLMGTLVPELTPFLQTFQTSLPFSTQLLIGFSKLISTYFFNIIFVSILGIIALKILITLHPKSPHWKSYCFEIFPGIGRIHRLLIFSHFFQSLSLMLSADIDLLQALSTSRESSPSHRFQGLLLKVEKNIQEGSSLSKAFEQEGIFPSFVIRILTIGEKTSTLPHNLGLLQAHFEYLSHKATDRVIFFLEPGILLFIAGILGWIILALFLPLYEPLTRLEYQ